ncbi:MAG TPA: hypothetical protein PLL66_04445 [Bacteroidales bacterium]|nr:hypothetical protein [Bacteroidales bacterium]
MKKSLFLFVLLTTISICVSSQPLSKVDKDFTYTFVSDEGTNASAVVWHPKKKLYFTVIAGNADFPIEAFDENGKSVYSEPIKIDCRGMWYNSKTKNIEVNGYSRSGWAKVVLNDKLNFHELNIIHKGMNQYNDNSCGTYYSKKKAVIFLNYEELCIDVYNYKDPDKISKIILKLRADNLDPYNYTTIGYTGKKGYEFVLLNVDKNALEFFNSKGEYAGSTALPKSVIVPETFRFSFTNERVFIYDVDSRTWTAYKVF